MRTWSSAVAVGLCLLLAPSMSNAATVCACKKKIGGTLRIVKTTTSCASTETKISWPNAAEVSALKAQVTASQVQVAALQDLLQHFSRNGNNVEITGANLWITSGSGTTDGTVNGLGNLNTVSGPYSSVSGGESRSATGAYNRAAGALSQDW